MLARIQQITTVLLIAAALVWFWVFWQAGKPGWAIAGCVAILLGYSVTFALELVILGWVAKDDPAPQATWREKVGAWWHESLLAPQIFCGRQPFRSHCVPDQCDSIQALRGQRGVVFVHGFVCNRGFWTPWLRRLKAGLPDASGQLRLHAFVAISLEPVFGSIDDYAAQIDQAVADVTEASGLPPLLVCHSMGGLVVRAWLKAHSADSRIFEVVTIGTPHRGTWLARFGHGANSRQMRLHSPWAMALDGDMPPSRPGLFTCWYSNCDNIVMPPSTATLPGAKNRFHRGAAHVQLAFEPEVMNATLALLTPAIAFSPIPDTSA